MVNEEVEKIIDFLILNPNKIRKLLGTDSEYFDVPISDHNKRDHRYNIRPLIETSNNNIIWGAAAAYRAGTIWIAHIANGYCIKDMRRLREKIFGRGDKRGQIGKIEKRINFLAANYNDIRTLLNWSEPADNHEVKLSIYILVDKLTGG